MLKNKKILCAVFLSTLLMGSGLLARGVYAEGTDRAEEWDPGLYSCLGDTYDEMMHNQTTHHDNDPKEFEDLDDDEFETFLLDVDRLWCYDYGIKSTVGLEKIENLKNLNLAKNEIETIDLSQNQAIEFVQLWDNKIEYLNLSRVSDSIIGLYLDDDVLVRTNFIAKQLTKGGDFYAAPSTDIDRGRVFIPLTVAVGLSSGNSEIVTEGAHYYKNNLNDNCLPGDGFCIVFDADILNYQNYIQLKYVGPEDASKIGNNYNFTKQNYRLEINLEAWQDDEEKDDSGKDGGSAIKVPDTGAFSNMDDKTTVALISLGTLAMISGLAYLIAYAVKRLSARAKFNR